MLVRNEYLSVDPAMRGWASGEDNYAPPVALGEVMRANAVGTVIESQHPRFREGDRVVGRFGWQEFALIDAALDVRAVSDAHPPSLALGLLGASGVTAWLGLIEIAAARPGDLVVVSSAAGSVGSAVGQLARLTGCRTVGVTGSSEKARACIEEFGFDDALDYRASDFTDRLARSCAAGVDVYFDNTSGPISDAVMRHLAHRARVVICGTASVPTWDPLPSGPRPNRQLLIRSARMEGVLLQDHAHEVDRILERLGRLVSEGVLRSHEFVLDGLDAAPGAVRLLYDGGNLGKMLIRLEQPAIPDRVHR
jgi:NADPH-dependent curcumin reductase CurA